MPRTPPRRLTALLTAGIAGLAGCGPEDRSTAADPTTEQTTEQTTEATAEPTTVPTVGTYPSFEPEDYTFQLIVSCFCVGAGVPIEVTVVDAQVVDAIYLGGGRGSQAGEPADEYHWLTINDIIDAANETDAAQVTVDWPADQDHPSSVWVDQDLNTVDEEIGYEVSNVFIG